jgi:hypothetical protein
MMITARRAFLSLILSATIMSTGTACAQAGRAYGTIGVSATVIRPVSVSIPSSVVATGGSMVVVREARDVEVTADNGVVHRTEDGDVTVTVPKDDTAIITITY